MPHGLLTRFQDLGGPVGYRQFVRRLEVLSRRVRRTDLERVEAGRAGRGHDRLTLRRVLGEVAGRELGPTRVIQLERDGRGVRPLGGVEAERALDRLASGDEDATDLD